MELQNLSNIPGSGGGAPPLDLIPSSIIRQGDHPELPAPLPGLLEGYLTVLAGAGGVGKTYLAEQIARHISSGVRLGRFPLPDDGPGSVWALFLEDVASLTQARSLDVAEFGSLPEDQQAPDTGADSLWYCDDSLRGIASLRARLHEAKERGTEPGPRLPDVVIIDYLHLFIGDAPAGASPVSWERQKLTDLRELAIEFGFHCMVLTHMTKEGKVNGTNSLLNVCDAMFVVELKDDRNYAVLNCRKMRVAPQTDYALSRRANGTWGFDDQVFVSEVLADGIMRDVLAVLKTEGPKTLSQLCIHHAVPGTRDGIRQALRRGRQRRWVTTYAGHWRITPSDGDTALRPADDDQPPAGPVDGDRLPGGMLVVEDELPCTRCGEPSRFRVGGQPMHIGGFCQPTTDPAPAPAAPDPAPRLSGIAAAVAELTGLQPDPAPVPAPRPAPSPAVEKQEPDPVDLPWYEDPEAPDRSDFDGLGFMKKTIAVSRYHAKEWAVVPKDLRDQEPWTLITEDMGGEPRGKDWTRPDVPLGGVHLLLDRNGSFPSACSSVPLAPAKLTQTGAVPYDSSRAGIYLIDVPEWTDTRMPHPLGAMAYTGDLQVWVNTPHIRLLLKLAQAGTIAEPTILDSWTGKANSSVFQAFYKGVRDARPRYLAQHDPAAGENSPYVLYKRSVSRPLRLLWPKAARSPFWRPDWRTAMVAEASVRHWLKAWEAVRQGAFLISLRNVDAALFWTPDGQVPAPYEVGDLFGQVKVKEIQQ